MEDRKGMGVKVEFGPAPGEEEAGWAKQNVFFLCRAGSFFFFVWRTGGRRSGRPSIVWRHFRSGTEYGYT